MSPIGQFKQLDPIDKSVIRIAGIAAAALLAVVILAVAVIALATASKSNTTAKAAQDYAQADCQTWRDLSVIAPAASTSSSGLQLFADFRKSYLNKGCIAVLGNLPPADPRIAPLVPAAVK